MLACWPVIASEYVTPQQYGAIGDGSHDDTKAIQQALNSGQEIRLLQGVYLINGKLSVPSGTTIIGQEGAVIKQTKDRFIFYNKNAQVTEADWDTDITIRGITFDATLVDARSEYCAGLFMCGVRNLVVEDCRFIDIGGDGIYLGRGGQSRNCEGVRIVNCSFVNCGRNAANPRQSVAVVDGTGVIVQSCTMENTRHLSYAVDLEPNQSDEKCEVQVIDCQMKGCGISCGGKAGAKREVYVSGCSIDCSSTTNAPISLNRTKATLVGNTIISNKKQNGITVIKSPGVVITGNTITNASAGILVTETSKNVAIKKNIIKDSSHGVYVMNSPGGIIEENTISEIRKNGVYVRLGSGDARIMYNDISSNGFDIYAVESDNLMVSRNNSRSAKEGIYINANGSSVSQNRSQVGVRVEGSENRVTSNQGLK